jgi:monovalent cation:H+ antiporter, CPA1 family
VLRRIGSIAPWTVLLLIASVVGVLARRLHVPYSVGLVVAGIGLALLPWHPSVTLSRELVYNGILPPLIFDAAFALRREALRRNLALVVLLATVGVVLSALVTGAVMTGLVHWPISAGLLFGILMAATDPVSVLATLKEIGARGRLALLIEAESLLNDGTATVLFAIVVGFVTGEPLTYKAVAIALGAMAGARICRWIPVLPIHRLPRRPSQRRLRDIVAENCMAFEPHQSSAGCITNIRWCRPVRDRVICGLQGWRPACNFAPNPPLE